MSALAIRSISKKDMSISVIMYCFKIVLKADRAFIYTPYRFRTFITGVWLTWARIIDIKREKISQQTFNGLVAYQTTSVLVSLY